jgi:hypothetical protein
MWPTMSERTYRLMSWLDGFDADPTLICPDPAAHEEHVEPPSEATWRDLPQSRHEGYWFTPDSLAAALLDLDAKADTDRIWRALDNKSLATAIIKAAKEASE